MSLDQPAGFAAVDTADALADVEGTPAQWAAARELADVRLDLDGVDVVVVTGMGGSGIAGDVTAAIAAPRLGVPVIPVKGYDLPAFAGPRTLVVACSHSGNTEETLAVVESARAAGTRRFAVTSGGRLLDVCRQDGTPHVVIPGGGQPRHALGRLAVPVLVALGLDDGIDEALDVLTDLAAACARDVPAADNPAKQLALRLASGSVPLAWGARGLGAVAAYRLKCQLHENAKLPAAASELPELDHNEVVGLAGAAGGVSPLAGAIGLVLLRDPTGEGPRITARFAITEELVRERCAWIAEVTARGAGPLARLASLLLLVDLASVYTAIESGVDPTPIAAIDTLKARLAT